MKSECLNNVDEPEKAVIPSAESDIAIGGRVRGGVFVLFFPPWTLLCSLLSIGCGLCGWKSGFSWVFKIWSKGLLQVAGVRLETTGLERLTSGKPYLFICNHQSAFDIPLLANRLALQHHLRFMAKESLFRIPFFGQALTLNDFIPVDRADARDFAGRLERAGIKAQRQETAVEERRATPKTQCSFLIFPEGTRSPDGRLQPFFKGVFNVALRVGLDVAPLTLIDACKLNPKKKLAVRPGTVRLTIHPPISLAALVPPDAVGAPGKTANDENRAPRGRRARDLLAERVRHAILAALPPEQQPLKETCEP
jgi:1-acyl-sn-glycerol-3-phosphate acyltransferase